MCDFCMEILSKCFLASACIEKRSLQADILGGLTVNIRKRFFIVAISSGIIINLFGLSIWVYARNTDGFSYSPNSIEDSDSTYLTNEQGQTYGPRPDTFEHVEDPDLLEAIGENGIIGYVKLSDLDSNVSSPEEALTYQESAENSEYISIPLYNSDGETVIGEFRMNNYDD